MRENLKNHGILKKNVNGTVAGYHGGLEEYRQTIHWEKTKAQVRVSSLREKDAKPMQC